VCLGACCNGTVSCSVRSPFACANLGHSFRGGGTTCAPCDPCISPPGSCCPANFNHVGGLTIQDIFDFLNAWLAGNAAADFNGGGLSVQDIFDFLNAWFAGCP
jgi:hypothetical protein